MLIDKNKFLIEKAGVFNYGWIRISPLFKHYEDIDGEGTYKLVYSYHAIGDSLNECNKNVSLKDSNNIWQCINKNHEEFYRYISKDHFISDLEHSERIKLQKWFEETEKFILESIPELEKFAKNYIVEDNT